MKRVISIIGIVIIAAILIIFIFLSIISSGKIRIYTDEQGNKLPNSLSEKIKININGAENGLFINSKDINNPVLLFVSSGPGTDDYFLNEKYKAASIEDTFTIAYWDYRGMGIVYDSHIDPETITSESLINDTLAITEYLKERFNKDKIYIMGFSGGSMIALDTVSRYPDNYYAYIGMAQVVTDSSQRDELMYHFMKETFEERQDRKSLNKLEKLIEYNEQNQIKCKDWRAYVYMLHKAGGGTTHNESELVGIDIPIIMSHCYTIKEKLGYIRGLKMYRETAYMKSKVNYDYRKDIMQLKVPVFFISGEYDYNCPWSLVKEYCNIIEAPDKECFIINEAAHSPLWENAVESHQIMINIKERTYNE